MEVWSNFKINRGGNPPIEGQIRGMGLHSYLKFLNSDEDPELSSEEVVKDCTRNLSVPIKEWELGIVSGVFNSILELTEKLWPTSVEELQERYNTAKTKVHSKFFNVVQAYICACFNYKPEELEDLSPDEIFLRYNQACLIFPELVPQAAETQQTTVEDSGRKEFFCTACNAKSQYCGNKEAHRTKDWVRTN